MPKAAAPPPTASTNTVKVQADWQNREFMQAVQLGVAQLTSFLNDFGASHHMSQHAACITPTLPMYADGITRGKLSQLDGKLAKLERRMEVIEGTLQSVDQGQGA